VSRVLGISVAASQPDSQPQERVALGLSGFTKRLAALLPSVQAAIASGHTDSQELRLKITEAGVFARKPDLARAHALLDLAEALLRAPAQSEQLVPSLPGGLDAASAESLTRSSAKLSAMPRPDAEPSTRMTAALLTAAKSAELPADDTALSDLVSEFALRFLATVLNEPNLTATPLAEGSMVPAQDQLLGVADQFNAGQRSMERWAALLDEAETSRMELDRMEESDSGPDFDAYAAVLAKYNLARIQGIEAEAQTAALLEALRTACTGLQTSGAVP
jgi:hypothetical protein